MIWFDFASISHNFRGKLSKKKVSISMVVSHPSIKLGREMVSVNAHLTKAFLAVLGKQAELKDVEGKRCMV